MTPEQAAEQDARIYLWNAMSSVGLAMDTLRGERVRPDAIAMLSDVRSSIEAVRDMLQREEVQP